ncbi:MAG: Major Facilitator Superfamily protein [Methanoregula sp. PtaU1.Bin051]|nr:MAG: Major Facilitator Superfamily protein [Methanoregula sp. PtaU1.Bin051]
MMSPKETLDADEISTGLSYVIKDGLATQAMVTLTSGIFLVAFGLKLGASNTVIGLLAAIPPLAELIQMPAITVVEKIRNRRFICVGASIIARLFWIVIALIPFLFGPAAAIPVLVLSLILYGCISAVSHCSWNSWMRDLVPQEILGSFFSRRMALSLALGIVLSLAAGGLIDIIQRNTTFPPGTAYSVIFIGGFIAGLFGIWYMSKIPEPLLKETATVPFTDQVRSTFHDDNFTRLITFLGAWNFAVNLAAPFFTVYLLVMLDLDITLVIALAVLSQVASVLSYHMWGRISDRYSNKSVLRVSGPLFMICILGWTFTTMPAKHMLTLPLLVVLHILMGVSTAGVTLASANIGLKLAPAGSATAYLATINITNSLAAGIAPVIGGMFVDSFEATELSLTLNWVSPGTTFAIQTLDFTYWDFFFVFAFFIGMYSIHRLAYVKEAGEVEERLVVHEMIAQVSREMRNLSTIGGLRYMLRFPVFSAHGTGTETDEKGSGDDRRPGQE